MQEPSLTSVWFFGTGYIIPQMTCVVLGGATQKRNDWNTTVSLQDTKKIIDGHSQRLSICQECNYCELIVSTLLVSIH